MSVRLRLLVFAAGVAVFLFLVIHVGPIALLGHLRQVGWKLVPIVLLWIPVFLCWAAAWRLTMPAAGAPSFWRVLVVGIAGHSINEITPFAQVGGEPFRVAALSQWLGRDRATGSVITYYMLHSLSNMAIWVAGIVLVLALYSPPAVLIAPMVALGALIVAAMVFIFTRHRGGVVAPLLTFTRRIPVVRRLAAPLERHRPKLEELDRHITGFYHERPGHFWLALLFDALGRAIATLEYWFIGQGLGLQMSPLAAFVIGSFGALAINLIFFMPMQAGTKEGGLFFAFRLVGFDPSLGVFAAIVQRLRELSWIGVGLLLIWLAGGRQGRGPASQAV